MKNLLAIAALMLAVGCLMQLDGPDMPNSTVDINILAGNEILFEGDRLDPDALAEALSSSGFTKENIVSLTVEPDAEMGTVADVQKALREANVLRINYRTEDDAPQI